MKKKKLMELPVPELPESLVDSMPETEKVKKYGWTYTRNNIFFDASVDSSTEENILIVDFWKPNGEHICRHFLSKDNKYLTAYGDKQSRASFEYLHDNILACGSFHPVSETAESNINDFLKHDLRQYSGIERLYHYSCNLVANRLKAKQEKIRQSINDEMLVVRLIPKTVERWIDNVLMADSQYIFYENNGRKETTGYCTCCQKIKTLLRPKHKSYGKCPECKKSVQFISKAMFIRISYIADDHTCAWIQKTPEGCVIRKFTVIRKHISRGDSVDGMVTEQYMSEDLRQFYTYDNSAKEYQYKSCYQNYYGCWTGYGASTVVARLCPVGLNKILRHEGLKAWYTDFEKIAKQVERLEVTNLIRRDYHDYPMLAQLANAKLSNLLASFINGMIGRKCLDMDAKNLTAAFKLDKADINRLVIPLNPDFAQLEVIQTALHRKDKSDISDYRYLFDYSGNCGYEANIIRILEYMTIHRLAAYIKKQKANTEKFDRYDAADLCWRRQNFFRDYLDYISNAEVLGWDTASDSVRFPKNFISAHDHAAAEVKVLEDMKKQEFFKKIEDYEAEYNKKYYFVNEKLGLLIRAPHDQKEIVYEGTALHHCVATYRERVAKKETIILFIRKTDDPDTPYFTLNLNPRNGEIIQCRGLQNCSYPSDVKKFMDEWHKEKVENINKENRIRIGA